jgi:hypothetical protein
VTYKFCEGYSLSCSCEQEGLVGSLLLFSLLFSSLAPNNEVKKVTQARPTTHTNCDEFGPSFVGLQVEDRKESLLPLSTLVLVWENVV